jgi:acyl carrier protein
MTPKFTDLTLEEEIVSVFSKITRYPLEILDPDASLEEELGIDSVKLGEVFSVLREQYSLPQDMGLTPDMLKNIRSISIALEKFLGGNGNGNGHAVTLSSNGHSNNGHSAPQANNGRSAAYSGNGHHSPVAPSLPASEAAPPPVSTNRSSGDGRKDILSAIQAVFSEITRYPIEILDPQAQLEEDLGIDSVKLGESFR